MDVWIGADCPGLTSKYDPKHSCAHLENFNVPIQSFVDLERNTEAVKMPLHRLKNLIRTLKKQEELAL